MTTWHPTVQQSIDYWTVTYSYVPDALLTAGTAFDRLSPLAVDEGVGMTERSYEQLQARAVHGLDDSYAGEDGSAEQAAALSRAQTYSLLAFSAAIHDLAKAIRETR